MIAFVVLGSVVAFVLAAVVVVRAERDRRTVIGRVDRLTNQLGPSLRGHSPSSDVAIERLETALEGWRASVVDADRERRYLAALEAIPFGVAVIDEQRQPMYTNRTATRFRSGRHSEAVVADTIDRLIAKAEEGVAVEETVQLYGPPRRRLFITAAPISAGTASLGVLVLIDDITEQERIDSIRRDFITNISHELRTPIGAMSLLAETLADERDPAVVEALAVRLSGEAERLSATVDDLLELSRIEHGGDVDFEPVVLQDIVNGAHDRVRAAAQQREVVIGVTMPERDLLVEGDRRQLTSAIYNLLDNGVKYCGPEGGTVSIRARLVDDVVHLSVQDSGIGIPRKDLDRIFERFYRVDRGRSRTSGGTGLGLSMVRHIVANHGGRVHVESAEGEGATFTIELPVLPPSPGATQPDTSSDGDMDHETNPHDIPT
ncbi:MAG: ATP-binding protein [Acidimicrobiales bacterium]